MKKHYTAKQVKEKLGLKSLFATDHRKRLQAVVDYYGLDAADKSPFVGDKIDTLLSVLEDFCSQQHIDFTEAVKQVPEDLLTPSQLITKARKSPTQEMTADKQNTYMIPSARDRQQLLQMLKAARDQKVKQ